MQSGQTKSKQHVSKQHYLIICNRLFKAAVHVQCQFSRTHDPGGLARSWRHNEEQKKHNVKIDFSDSHGRSVVCLGIAQRVEEHQTS